MTEFILRVLGLDYVAETVVGGPMLRGISGGQKKRVTTGEMIVGPCKTLLMDGDYLTPHPAEAPGQHVAFPARCWLT